MILEKTFTNQRKVIKISLENSIILVYLQNLYNRFTPGLSECLSRPAISRIKLTISFPKHSENLL